MIFQVIIAGFTLGMISSLHCVGMCGPLVMSLPVYHMRGREKLFSLLTYHFGRISTYAVFGLIFGLLGRRIFIAGFQRWFSIGLGIFIIFILIRHFFFKNSFQPVFLKKYYQKIQQWSISLWKDPSKKSFLLLGIANGLLPCGMVYIAIAAALSISDVMLSVFFMVLFGIGTLPALLSLGYFGYLINISARNKMKKIIPFFMAGMGLLLILRGLNLGIPFLSPNLGQAPADPISCH
ncbi:MAG: sulfite exporter TauE/SafE family protein [Bacteroidetes bacterium]|nr:sulfite exporter TauE/SafE family protein [Bacteroidota bacterium]